MKKMLNLKIKTKTFLLLGLLLFLVAGGFWEGTRGSFSPREWLVRSFNPVKPVSAQEIYPLFECPCCGKAINDCSCPMAGERRSFVDGVVAGRVTEEEAILAYVKKYGLDSLRSEEKRKQLRQKLLEEAPKKRAKIVVAPDSLDLGDVSQKKGVVTTLFEIKNEGSDDLVIERMETSCGCTSAAIVYQGKEGPKFNMPGHGINEKIKGWQVVIPSGETAQLKVYYDPNVHQEFRGAAVREVSIFSNDPVDFEKKVQIELRQVD